MRLPRSGDVPKFMLGASLTVAWVVMVDAIFAGELLVAGGSCLSGESLYLFDIAALAIAVWLGSLATFSSLGEMVASFVGEGATAERRRARRARGSGVRAVLAPRLAATVASPWPPVTCLFLLAGWLIYRSGGTTASPYAPVPLLMMAVGQSVYETPSVRIRREARLWNVAILFADVIRHYVYPLLLFALVVVAPIVLDSPAQRPAPRGLLVFTSVLALVLSMCVVAASRLRDQTPPSPGARTPSS